MLCNLLKAAPDGDGFVLNGTKRFITNAAVASVFTVFARTDPTTAGGKGVSAFVVDAATPGTRFDMRFRSNNRVGHVSACSPPTSHEHPSDFSRTYTGVWTEDV